MGALEASSTSSTATIASGLRWPGKSWSTCWAKMSCVMLPSLSWPTSKICRIPCLLQRLQRSWVCVVSPAASGSFSLPARPRETVCTRASIGSRVRCLVASRELSHCIFFPGQHIIRAEEVMQIQCFYLTLGFFQLVLPQCTATCLFDDVFLLSCLS